MTAVKRHVVLRVNATRRFTSPLRKDDDSIPLFDRRAIPSSRPRYGDASRAVAVQTHRGDPMQSVIFKGLKKKMGLHVEDEDVVPKRQRRAR
jgi:hypothetical protein